MTCDYEILHSHSIHITYLFSYVDQGKVFKYIWNVIAILGIQGPTYLILIDNLMKCLLNCTIGNFVRSTSNHIFEY